jgi:hypothetical protein
VRTYDFDLVLSRPLVTAELDPFFQRTRGLVTVGFVDDLRQADHPGTAGCCWEASSLASAVMEVIGHLEAAAPGLRVLRVEADPLLSLREIAERTGRTAESVRLAIKRPQIPTFPTSETSVAGHRQWRWSAVAEWYGLADPRLREAAPTAQAINGWLAMREIIPEVTPEPYAVVAAVTSAIRASA